MTLYDALRKRIAVFEKQATPEFWDAQWERESVQTRLALTMMLGRLTGHMTVLILRKTN